VKGYSKVKEENESVDSRTIIIDKYFNSMYVIEISAGPQEPAAAAGRARQCAAWACDLYGRRSRGNRRRFSDSSRGDGSGRAAPTDCSGAPHRPGGPKQAHSRGAGCAHLDIARADSPRTPAWAGAGREHHIATGADRRSLLLNQCGRQANGHVGQDRERLLRQPTSFWPPRGRW
jgi:hypothetical protein